MRSWMIDPNTAENMATFMWNVCWGCQRMWNALLRPEAQPICVAPSALWGYCELHANEGNPPEYDLPEWTPTDCGAFIAK